MAIRQLQIKPSSNIDQAHYDEDQQTLQVHFKSGGVYVYDGFTGDAADAFERADSSGKHLNSNIIGQYVARKI